MTDETAIITRQEQLLSQQQAQLQQVGQYVMQLGATVAQLTAELKAIKRQQAAVTLTHAQTLEVQRRARAKAAALCERYRLAGSQAVNQMKATILKDVLRAQGVKNLHDIPAASLDDIKRQVDGFTGFEASRSIKEKAAKGSKGRPQSPLAAPAGAEPSQGDHHEQTDTAAGVAGPQGH